VVKLCGDVHSAEAEVEGRQDVAVVLVALRHLRRGVSQHTCSVVGLFANWVAKCGTSETIIKPYV
jgi:hypothetical protein